MFDLMKSGSKKDLLGSEIAGIFAGLVDDM